MKTIFYRQCVLKKLNTQQVSYIPDKFAIAGKGLKLKGDDGWDDGWVVVSAGSQKVPENLLPDTHKDVKAHRKRTGDSNKKKVND